MGFSTSAIWTNNSTLWCASSSKNYLSFFRLKWRFQPSPNVQQNPLFLHMFSHCLHQQLVINVMVGRRQPWINPCTASPNQNPACSFSAPGSPERYVLSCRFPMYIAFLCSEYYQQVRLPPWHPFACGWSFQLAYSAFAKTVTDLPGSVTIPFPPCHALRPRRSLHFPRLYRKITIAFQVFDLVGLRTF